MLLYSIVFAVQFPRTERIETPGTRKETNVTISLSKYLRQCILINFLPLLLLMSINWTFCCWQLPDQDERFRKIQTERDNLQLQVQVLTDQIEAQTDKINDLEKLLGEKKQLLVNAEDTLQRVSSINFRLLNKLCLIKN